MEPVSDQLVLRITRQDKARLEAKAARLGLSTAAYARMILNGVAEPLERCGEEGGEPLPRLLVR